MAVTTAVASKSHWWILKSYVKVWQEPGYFRSLMLSPLGSALGEWETAASQWRRTSDTSSHEVIKGSGTDKGIFFPLLKLTEGHSPSVTPRTVCSVCRRIRPQSILRKETQINTRGYGSAIFKSQDDKNKGGASWPQREVMGKKGKQEMMTRGNVRSWTGARTKTRM